MYSFLLDQTYINLLILLAIVVLLMFLWRKLSILEGNFFVLEKRVNLLKKDAREDSIAKNIDKADIIMNEIFKDYCPMNACKVFGGISSAPESCDALGVCQKNKSNTMRIDEIDENMVQYIAQVNLNDAEADAVDATDTDIITFAGSSDADGADDAGDADGADEPLVEAGEATEAGEAGEADGASRTDIDKMVDTIISSSEEYSGEHNESDNVSVSSEITFTSDDKKNEKTLYKKYSKMSLDKLKDYCVSNKINSEGTKNQLIANIIKAM